MRFSCDECGRVYVASDEVAGRAFRMRCKSCGAEIVVRPPVDVDPELPAPAAEAPDPAAVAPPVGSSPAGSGPAPRTAFEAAPPPAPVPPSAPPREARAEAPRPRRPAFDPFEGDDLAGEIAVGDDALELLDLTPPARPLPRAPAQPSRTPSAPAPRAAPAPVPRRMLPAEDEAKLGPPGAEDRRDVPRWAIAAAVAAAAAAGAAAYLFLR